MNGKRTILIVDDQELNREILKLAFQNGYQLLEAENGEEALNIIYKNKDALSAILLDIFMPIKDGYAVLEELETMDLLQQIPVLLITSETDQKILEQGFLLGASDVISKPFNPSFIRRKTDNLVELYAHRSDLQHVVDDQIQKLKQKDDEIMQANRSLIDTLSTAIEFRDCESGQHISRTRYVTSILLHELVKRKQANFSEHEIELISDAAVMHDVGKISIPDTILNKPGKLTKEEFDQMKQHTILGCELLESIEALKKSELYTYCYDICRHHHERWDGHGYPDHLKGNEISIWAQVVSIVDVFDALVSKRVYKQAYDFDTAMSMIEHGECGTFNPILLDCFRSISNTIYQHYQQQQN